MNPVDRLARHVAATSHEALPAGAVRAAKTFLLDTLGVAVAGSAEPWAARLAEMAGGWGAGTEAAAWVHGTRLPAPSAAWVNAYAIHCLEYDCVHEGAVVHAMATLAPAVLAQAERLRGVSGRELLAAIAAGVDVAATLGLAARGPMRFFRPATAGAFGATAALCRLEGWDAEATARALGMVYGQVAGTMQPHVESSPLLAMQMGFNARAALHAVELSRLGVPAPRDVLVGRHGYFHLFENGEFDLEPHLARLGEAWQIERVSHKPFPSGRLTHGAVDGLLQLQTRHGFGVEDVARIVLAVPPLVFKLVGREDVADPSPNYARLCVRYVAAAALLGRGVAVSDFAPARLTDPALHALAARIEVAPDGNRDETALVPQQIEVTLRNGTVWSLRMERVLGSPEAPLTAAQNVAKFRRNWELGAVPLPPEQGERLIELVERLEDVADVRELAGLMAP